MKLPILALATAALLCGASVVSAQENPNGGAPASDQTRNPRERPSDQTKQPGDQTKKPGAGQEAPARNMGSEEVREHTQPQGGQMLRGGEMRDRDEMRGGGVRNLTVEQKTNLRETVLRTGPRVTNINFRIGVGVVVPRTVRLVAVPQPIIAIYPEWSGDLFFDYGDEIVVVAPDTLQIVGVLPL